MSQATLSHNNPVSNFKLENALPWLRTLIDMLLVCGGLFALLPLRTIFRFPSHWPMAVFQVGCLASALAGATLIVSTARTNRLRQRKIAFTCIATVMLFIAGLSVLVSQVLPNTELMSGVYLMTMCIAVWGCICSGLISIEQRIVAKLRMKDSFRSDFGIVQTLGRFVLLPFALIFSMNFVLVPVYIIQLLTDPLVYFQPTIDSLGICPTAVEMVTLGMIGLWVILWKCGNAVLFWALLIRFHIPNSESPIALSAAVSIRWINFYNLFFMVGVAGIISLVISCNATEIGLASAPWILAAMIFAAAIGTWKILQKERASA